MKTEREQFEARFPVPTRTVWCELRQEYRAGRSATDCQAEAADAYNDRWETWQAARLAYAIEAVALSLPPVLLGKCCHCTTLVPLRSMNLKICADCGKEHPWELAPGQQPLIGNNRSDRRAAE